MKRYKDLIANLQESEPKLGTVKTHKYSWGTMKTVHHGADFSIPLHPEHHQAISKLKDEQEHKFKDETGRHWVARRKGDHVHFDTTGNGSMKTHVPMHTMHEEYQGEPLTEEDHSELARQAAAEYRKAIARGDSVAANAANAEHIRHKKSAQAMRKKSHTPGEIDEASDHDPYYDAQENKKSAEAARKQGDHFAYHLHMSDHHSNMAHWSSNRGRYHVANQHQAKAEQHHDWAMQHKNGVRKEELELQEGKMGQIHADIEDHLGKHLQHYKKVGGAEHFANKVMKTHEHIAKLHGLEKKHAASLVNSYVDSQLKEETLSEEHLVHVSDGSKYGEEPHPKDVEHVMSGAKTHGGEFDGHSDKGAYFKFKSQSDAKNFKRHVDSCPNKTCHADLHESTQIQEGTEIDLDKYFAGIEMKGGEQKKKPAVKKEPENTIKGSQIKFLNTFKEETDINEKLNLAKSKMGDVIKDFQQSDAPQFSGKSKEKRREMAIAAKLEADRQQNEGVIQPSGTDAIDFGVDKPKDTVVRDKKGKLISFKHEGAWKKSTGTITDKGGAKHGPMSQARHLARSAMKTVKEEAEQIDEISKDTLTSYARNANIDRHKSNTIRHRAIQMAHGGDDNDQEHANKIWDRETKNIEKRTAGMKSAVSRLRKEEVEVELDEGLGKMSRDMLAAASARAEKGPKRLHAMYSAKVGGKELLAKHKKEGNVHYVPDYSKMTKEEVEELDEADTYSIENPKTKQVYHLSKYPITKYNEKYRKIKAAGGNHVHATIYKNGKPVSEEVKEHAKTIGGSLKKIDQFDRVIKEESEDLIEQQHIVHVTVSDPNHTMVSKRKETIQKRATVTAKDKQSAISAAISHYKKQGYKVHDDHYVGLKEEVEIDEQAPVAPVPGQKWKDHAVMVNGRQRVVIHRKNIGNYSKEEGWKEVAPGQKVKEDVDMDGNYVSEPMSYQEFVMMIEGRAQYIVKATHNKTGRVKVTNYVADKDESEYGVRSRAEREHKPMGFSIDSIRKKDVEAHGEGDEEESTTQKRGRGRPAGSKSGARGPRIK